MPDTPSSPNRPVPAPPRRPRPPRRSDATNNALVIGIIATILGILGMLVAALTLGDLGGAKAPRTFVERQISSLETVVKTQPAVGRAWADLARALIEVGQLDQASDVIEQGLVAAAADKAPIMVEQARLQYRRGDARSALKTLQGAIVETNRLRDVIVKEYRAKEVVMDPRAMPMDAIISAAILESVIYRELKQPDKAAEALTVALAERPNMADVLTERGLLYVELKRPADARKDFETALTFIPDYADAKKGLRSLGTGSGR
jgi:tetratricopeptide (TPR) repeat protein